MTGQAHCQLSNGGMTLTVERHTAAGTLLTTFERERGAGPFTAADVAYVLSEIPAAARTIQPGQRNTAHRFTTGFGVLWLHVMTGPPAWWLPRLKHEKDGTCMAGWLRLAVAVRFDRKAKSQ